MKRILLATIAAAICATSLPGCKTMEKRSDGEKALIAAGVGILAAIVGKAVQAGTEDSAGGGMEGKSAAAGGGVSGDINAAKALGFLYGSKVRVLSTKEAEDVFGDSRCSEWVPWIPPAEYLGDPWNESLIGKTAAVCKVLDVRYTEGGVEKYMMLTETRYSASEDVDVYKYSGPIVGGFIFAKEGGQWKLEIENKAVSTDGSYGASGLDEKIVRVGSEKYGVLVHHSVSGWGAGNHGISVTMPYKGTFSTFSVLDIDWCGMPGEETTEDLSVKFDETSDGEYYDAIASFTSGMVNKNGDVVKKKKMTERFRFVDGEYKEVKVAKKTSAKKRK